MATLERSLGDITNSVNQLSIFTPSKPQPSSSKQTTLQIIQKNSSSPINNSPNHQNGSSFDAEESLLTASESDAFTDDDDEENNISSSEREGGDEENGDITAATYTSKQRSRAPPPIFFGTPSKAEHDRRHKYQAKLRTRRLLRKDSIELTRRKSGGWEGHETVTDCTIEDDNSSTRDVDAEESHTEDACEEKENEESIAESIHPVAEEGIFNDEVPFDKTRVDEQRNVASDEEGCLSAEQDEAVDDAILVNATSTEGDAGNAAADGLEHAIDEEDVLPNGDAAAGSNEIDEKMQMQAASDDVGIEQPREDDINATKEISEDDPDATEEADWFNIKSGKKAVLPSSPLPPSLPSTPTRQKGANTALDRCRASLAPSEADSSPGIALAPYPFSSRPSPMNYAGSRGKGSPFVNSPTMSYMSNYSPQFERENEGHVSQQGTMSRSGPVLRESPRKGNAANSLYSPTKVEVRSKLAAWANAKVKTPQSPEKREFDAMRLSSIQQDSFSPTLKSSHISLAHDLLDIASQVPLPLSPKKTHLTDSSSNGLTTQISQSTPSQAAQRAASPVRSEGSLRTSRLPVPAVSKLPRPFKLSVSKNQSQIQHKAGSMSDSKQDLIQKMSVNSERRPLARPNSSHASNVTNSQASTSSVNSKTIRNFDARMNGRRVLSTQSNHTSSSSSSPTKQVAKSNAPIVRDARLIAGKNAKPIPSSDKLENVEWKSTTNQEAPNATARLIVSEAPKAATMNASRAGSVGGARRVMRGGAVAVPRVEQTSQRKTIDENNSKAATSSRRLGMREAAPVIQTTITKDKNTIKARPMRRINDLIRKVDHSVSSPLRQQENVSHSEDIKSENAMKEKNDVSGLKGQRTTSGQGLRERTQPDQQSTHKSSGTSSSASSSPKGISLPFKAAPQMATSGSKITSAPRPIPISSMELSRLTSLHTRCNETAVAQLELIIIRKQGELRPPSPSSKFRKNAEGANSIPALTKSQKDAKEAQSIQARKDRAAQRAERLSGGGDNCSNLSLTSEQVDETMQLHRFAAGDEEIYSTPPRRITLKKAVRWHKALFAGPSDNMSGADKSSKGLPSFNVDRHSKPIKSCLAGSSQVALDRFGNVPQAGKPLGSPLVKRKKIIITKIVYDDDDSES